MFDRTGTMLSRLLGRRVRSAVLATMLLLSARAAWIHAGDAPEAVSKEASATDADAPMGKLHRLDDPAVPLDAAVPKDLVAADDASGTLRERVESWIAATKKREWKTVHGLLHPLFRKEVPLGRFEKVRGNPVTGMVLEKCEIADVGEPDESGEAFVTMNAVVSAPILPKKIVRTVRDRWRLVHGAWFRVPTFQERIGYGGAVAADGADEGEKDVRVQRFLDALRQLKQQPAAGRNGASASPETDEAADEAVDAPESADGNGKDAE